jgi:hypothetical protein
MTYTDNIKQPAVTGITASRDIHQGKFANRPDVYSITNKRNKINSKYMGGNQNRLLKVKRL